MYTGKYSSLRSYFRIKYYSHSNLTVSWQTTYDGVDVSHHNPVICKHTLVNALREGCHAAHDSMATIYARETVRCWANTIGADPTSWRFHKLFFYNIMTFDIIQNTQYNNQMYKHENAYRLVLVRTSIFTHIDAKLDSINHCSTFLMVLMWGHVI